MAPTWAGPGLLLKVNGFMSILILEPDLIMTDNHIDSLQSRRSPKITRLIGKQSLPRSANTDTEN